VHWAAPFQLRPSAPPVIRGTPEGVGQDVIGLGDLAKALGRLGILGAGVRMGAVDESAVGADDLLARRIGPHLEAQVQGFSRTGIKALGHKI
jgi:hypothetical protein